MIGEERTSRVAARSWRPALILAPLLGFAAGVLLVPHVLAGITGATVAFGILVVLGGASKLSVDEIGVTLTRLGRTRRIAWTDATDVVCWVRQPWGGRVSPLRVEITATGQPPSPELALPVSLRVDMIRRATAERGAAEVEASARKAGVAAQTKPWG